ncbi:MAG: helix-turn-helix domain-containing protein [Clostridiales bacterium]|nr:helix-turn-helix domain-containing protein [Clostridiales bacterium]
MSGLKIKRYREEKHYSQEELASLLGVTRRTISRWEQNSSKPNADELSKIAKFIGVTEEELLSDDDMYNSSSNVLDRISDGVDNLVSGQETINESIVSNRDEYGKKQDELINALQMQNSQLLSKLDEQAAVIESYKQELVVDRKDSRHKIIIIAIVLFTCLLILILVFFTWLYWMNHGFGRDGKEGMARTETPSYFEIDDGK